MIAIKYRCIKPVAIMTLQAKCTSLFGLGLGTRTISLRYKLTPRPRVKWVDFGRFRGEKRSADEYFSFQIQECESTTLETTLDAFCERLFNLLDATNAAIY